MREEEDTFRTGDGRQLFERSWLPDGDPKASVVIVHGYAEHSGRYHHVAERLAGSGYAVYAFDLQGHGRSEGRRAFVRSLDEHVADLRAFLDRVSKRAPHLPLFLLGHSMGGTVVALLLVSDGQGLRGAVLSAGGLTVQTGVVARIVQGLLAILARLAPHLPLGRLDSGDVSRDPAVVSAYDRDPRVYRGRMPAGTASALIRGIRRIRAAAENISVPLLVMHGSADSLTDPEGSRLLHGRAASQDKTLVLYDGLYHEIFNEPEREGVLDDVVRWLSQRSEPPAPT